MRIVLQMGLLLFSLCASGCMHASDLVHKNASCNHWESYAQRFVQDDGRVVEYSQGSRTTSEGQAYALFFALVANDRKRFDLILKWTENNLAKSDMQTNLPSWLWGKAKDKTWKVLDTNPASDADLWLAYTLTQAGKLWKVPQFTMLADAILNNIEKYEVTKLNNIGYVLLPTLRTTVEKDEVWKVNLSYTPIQILRFFSIDKDNQVWLSIAESSLKLMSLHNVKGLTADWIMYDRKKQESYLSEGAVMSYDAIRVYLWAGMLNEQDSLKKKLMKSLLGIDAYFAQGRSLPSVTSLVNNKQASLEPVGFSVAILPFLKSGGMQEAYQMQVKRVNSKVKQCLLGKPAVYYANSLAMFSQGWEHGHFSFGVTGELKVSW